MADFKLDHIQGSASGMDAFFEAEPQIITPLGQKTAAAAKPVSIRVASLNQLDGFRRLSAETLVNKSTQDLWSLRKEGEDYFIERLFQDSGSPVKG
jgi:hypothetical protein